MEKSPDAFRTISEVADWLGVQAHVLRFWESKFSQVKPVKRAGGRRYYRPSDMQLLGGIKRLLHDDGLTIKGVQKILREQGVGHVAGLSQPIDEMAASAVAAANGGPTVVAFQGKSAEPEPEPEEAVKSEPEPELNLEPEDAPTAGDEAGSPVDEPSDTTDDAARLPSFLHRDPPKEAPAPQSKPAVETPAAAKARVIDAPDPPPDAEIEVTAGALAHLSSGLELDAEQAAALAPLAAQLKAWRDRVAGAGG